MTIDVRETLRIQLEFWHGMLARILEGCDAAVLRHGQGMVHSIAAIYAHAVLWEDTVIHTKLRGAPSVFESGVWGSKIGVPSPGFPPALTEEWAASIDLVRPAFDDYARDVYAATDAYLAAAGDDELAKTTFGPGGEMPVARFLALNLSTHFIEHTGEIAALKGVQGLRGLPY